jgi:hypothetical protein
VTVAASPETVKAYYNADSLTGTRMDRATQKTYVEDAPEGGGNGSVKFTLTSGTPTFYADFSKAMTAYDGYSHIRITAKFVGTQSCVELSCIGVSETIKIYTLNDWVYIDLEKANVAQNYTALSQGTLGWFSFENTGVSEVYVYSIKGVNGSIDTAYISIDSENAVNRFTQGDNTTFQATYYTNANKPDSAYPNVPDGYTGAIAFKNVDKKKWMNVIALPQCGYADFAQADYIRFYAYCTKTVSFAYANQTLATLPEFKWTEVRLPLSVWLAPRLNNSGFIELESKKDMYYHTFADKLFLITGGGSDGAAVNDYVFCIASITLEKDEVDTTLQNPYAYLDETTVTLPYGSVQSVVDYEYDDVVMITSTDPNVQKEAKIRVTPGKTFEELQQYSKIRLTLKVETESETGQLFAYVPQENSPAYLKICVANVKSNEYVTVDIEQKYVLAMYAGMYVEQSPLIVYTSETSSNFIIYLSSIECIK